MDLGWATMMWAAPYLQLFWTSAGVLYGTLVASSPIAYHSGSTGEVRAARPPLAFLPCWFLNSFLFSVPIITIIAVGVPAGKLLASTNALEAYGCKRDTCCTPVAFLILLLDQWSFGR